MKTKCEVFVVFADEKLKKAFEKLKQKDPNLYKFITRAIDDLKKNPFCGVAIPKSMKEGLSTNSFLCLHKLT